MNSYLQDTVMPKGWLMTHHKEDTIIHRSMWNLHVLIYTYIAANFGIFIILKQKKEYTFSQRTTTGHVLG